MRKAILFIAIFAIALLNQAYAQPDSLWSQTYHGRDIDESPTIIQTSDGGYMIAGYTGAWNGGGHRCGFVVRTDSIGDQIWAREYEREFGFCDIFQPSDSSFLLGGSTDRPEVGRGACLLHIDSNGVETSMDFIGGKCSNIIRTSDGGFALASGKRIPGTTNDQIVLRKTDFSGIVQWENAYGEEGRQRCQDIIQTLDGGFALAGVTYSFKGQPNTLSQRVFYLVRTDNDGNLLWSNHYGLEGRENDECYSLVQTPDNGFALLGTSKASIYDNESGMYLVKTDSIGNEQWSRIYGRDRKAEGAAIILMDDNGFVLTGSIGSDIEGSENLYKKAFYLVRTDPDGNEIWSREFGGSGWNKCRSVIQTSDGGFALIGNTSTGIGPNDFLLIKTGPE